MHLRHDPEAPAGSTIGFEDFLAVDIRIGTITTAEEFPEARTPSYRLRIDFGPAIGEKRAARRSSPIMRSVILSDGRWQQWSISPRTRSGQPCLKF